MNKLFQVHMLNDAGKVKANAIAEAYEEAYQKLAALCPEGREFAVCKTKLEESCFFAKKSMAAQPENQVTQ